MSTSLDQLGSRDPRWWALGKLCAYREQFEPFIHIDSDVFIWNLLPSRLMAAPVFAQNPEYFVRGASYYQPEIIEAALGVDGWLPDEWRWYRSRGPIQLGYCCGIIGGQDLGFIHHYADQAINILEAESNQLGLQTVNAVHHTVLIEQYMLAACAQFHQYASSRFGRLSLACLFADTEDSFDPASADRANYTHIGPLAKQDPAILRNLEARVSEGYPQHYERCISHRPLAAVL